MAAENIGAESQQYDEPGDKKITPPATPDTGKKNTPVTPAKEQPKAVMPGKEDPSKKKAPDNKKKDDKTKPPATNKGDDYRK